MEQPSSSKLIIFLIPAVPEKGRWLPLHFLEDRKDPLLPLLEK